MNEAYIDLAAVRLDQLDGDVVKAAMVLSGELMERHHVGPGQEQQLLAHMLSALYIERAQARAVTEDH